MSEGIISIRKGREKPIINQHPWIFSGAIFSADNAVDGELVTVVDHKGNFLARGYYNSKSQIQVRILTWQDELIDDAWWRKMFRRAIKLRQGVGKLEDGIRLVNAENDFIPGLIIDKYGNWLVLQALTLFIDTHKKYIAELLSELLNIEGVYERSDVDVRGKEGLREAKGLLFGDTQPPHNITVSEGWKFNVDIINGHKTGFYLDQKLNREELWGVCLDFDGSFNLLNTFCYTGGFGVYALRDGVSVRPNIINVDASLDSLKLAERNFIRNWDDTQFGAIENHVQFIQADVFEYLRDCVERGDEYDIVILDPPKFAHNKRQVDKAARGYKDINLNAFKIIKSGGYLMTFSCSGAISRDLFQKIVFGALADSGRQAQIIKHLSAADDHPVALTFPEGEYLKGLLLRVY